jgi:hypothetical protein
MTLEAEDSHQQEEPIEENLNDETDEQEESENQQDSSEKRKRKRPKGNRPFPINTLEDSIKVAQVIRQFNGGNPWHPDEVAKGVRVTFLREKLG